MRKIDETNLKIKLGDIVLYDRYGSIQDSVSPSFDISDYAVGVVLQIVQELPGGFENSYAKIMKEDGAEGFFSLSYLYSNIPSTLMKG